VAVAAWTAARRRPTNRTPAGTEAAGTRAAAAKAAPVTVTAAPASPFSSTDRAGHA